MNKVQFPNLNGLRFIAALFVIITHAEQFKSWLGYKNYYNINSVTIIGKLGVILFFTLSGFLITYLLFIEKRATNTISVKQFYFRRMLRIWPLYYLIVILAFFVFPKLPFLAIGNPDLGYRNFVPNLSLYLIILPNLGLTLFGGNFFGFYAGHVWSIGVEEQYYVIWPFILRKIKKLDRFLIAFILGYNFLKIILAIILCAYPGNAILDKVYIFYNQFSIDCMAIGGLFAFYHFAGSPYIKMLFNKKVQIINLIMIGGLIIFGRVLPYFHYELFSVLFGILILNAATNPQSVVNLENKVFNYLGKISYGLYVYHLVLVTFSLSILAYYGITDFYIQYILILGLTIGIATISYYYFENFFLKKRHLFNPVK